jgi:hypothetical protein
MPFRDKKIKFLFPVRHWCSCMSTPRSRSHDADCVCGAGCGPEQLDEQRQRVVRRPGVAGGTLPREVVGASGVCCVGGCVVLLLLAPTRACCCHRRRAREEERTLTGRAAASSVRLCLHSLWRRGAVASLWRLCHRLLATACVLWVDGWMAPQRLCCERPHPSPRTADRAWRTTAWE